MKMTLLCLHDLFEKNIRSNQMNLLWPRLFSIIADRTMIKLSPNLFCDSIAKSSNCLKSFKVLGFDLGVVGG